jgi:hypothetical protein
MGHARIKRRERHVCGYFEKETVTQTVSMTVQALANLQEIAGEFGPIDVRHLNKLESLRGFYESEHLTGVTRNLYCRSTDCV